mgnify:CR=1 FL=1
MKELINLQDEGVIDEPKDELNQKFFDGIKLRRRIRKAILRLFDHLIEKLPLKKVEQFILEKNLVGSMTSFQWGEDSDLDLHIVIDEILMAQEYNAESLEILETLREVSKQLGGKLYLLGYPIEFYIQSKDEPFYSDGVYDVEYDTWTKLPEIKQFDKEKVKEAKMFAKDYKKYILPRIKTIGKRYNKYEKNQEDLDNIEKLKKDYNFINDEMERLKDKRDKSIRNEGNDSIENMKFKFLHRLGVWETMKEARKLLKTITFEPTDQYDDKN